MKMRNKIKWLQAKQAWWNKLSPAVQKATTKPGSVKTR